MRRCVKEYGMYVKAKCDIAYKESCGVNYIIPHGDIGSMMENVNWCISAANIGMGCITDLMRTLNQIDDALWFISIDD